MIMEMRQGFAVLFLLLFFFATSATARIVLPRVVSPIKKIPVAVSVLKADGEFTRDGKNFTQVVKNDLVNAALFEIRKVSTIFSAFGDRIDFDALLDKETAYLVSGSYDASRENVKYMISVYDVRSKRKIMETKYVTSPENSRRAAHEFSGELMKRITGLDGFFGSRIVFVRGDGIKKDLFVMDYDGKNSKRLTGHESLVLSPDCSPDGNEVIFSSNKKWDHDLYLVSPGGGKLPEQGRRITRGVYLDGSPRWSPDGSRVAFSRDGDIYVASASGEIQKRLTESPSIEVSPSWSPDGSRIAFVSDALGEPGVYVMSSSGGEPRRLTSGGYNTDPAWSPNPLVDRIAFVRMEKSDTDIYTVGADGSEERRLTSSGKNEHPSWSPDGRYITFSSKKEGKRKIYIMYMNGENKLPLSLGENDTFSSWCPE